MRHERPVNRRGFTLIAIVVTMAVLAIAAAVAAPLVFSANDQVAAARTAEILKSVDLALVQNSADTSGGVGWCSQIGRCPAFLSQMNNEIKVGDPCCCNLGTFSKSQNVSNWLSTAPFSGFPIVKGVGLKTPIGIIHDSLVWNGSDVELHIDSVPQYKAIYLDSMVDNAVNATSGVLRYALSPGTTTSQNLYLVKYLITSGVASCP